MARVVRPKKGKFVCPTCRKKFVYEMHLGRHRQTAHFPAEWYRDLRPGMNGRGSRDGMVDLEVGPVTSVKKKKTRRRPE